MYACTSHIHVIILEYYLYATSTNRSTKTTYDIINDQKNTPSQVRGTISPDGTTVVCGSENGELLFWRDGKAVVPPTVPQVRGGDRGTRRGVVVRMDMMKRLQ